MRVRGIESMSISALAFDLLPEENALIAGNLFGGVEFSGNARLVVIFVATRNEDTVAGSPISLGSRRAMSPTRNSSKSMTHSTPKRTALTPRSSLLLLSMRSCSSFGW